MKLIEPSLLSIDKNNAKAQLEKIKSLGIRFVHYDVMDGQFVPAKAYTNEYLDKIERLNLKANVHLMLNKPEEWIDNYFNNSVNSIVFHVETQSIPESKQILDKIHEHGKLAGISVKPNTDLNQYVQLFDSCDIILVMSVEPGFAGQGFLEQAKININKAQQIKKTHPNIVIQIDGGINDAKIKEWYKHIDWFVTGSWFFKNIDHMDQYLQEFEKLNN